MKANWFTGQMNRPYIILGMLWFLSAAACNLNISPGAVVQAVTETAVPEAASSAPLVQSSEPTLPNATETLTPTPVHTETATLTATVEPTASETPTPTETATPTITPTYAILRGKVLVQQANCRYGPGAPYLYKYGVYQDSVLEIIGRNDRGTWILIQAVGGSNACWVKADLLEIRGDVMSVAPTYIPLPPSPYYGPLSGVSAVRQEDNVIVSWHPLNLRAGDDSEQVPYVVEAWVCQGGELIFTPVGAYATMVTIVDEAGCAEPSRARVTAAEKHGYTAFVEVPWPPQE